MNTHLSSALEAARFIRAQKIDGRAKWRRNDAPDAGSDYSLYHGSCGNILLLLELHAAGQDADALAEAVAAGEEVQTYLQRKDWLSVSPSTGWPGYAFALNELARASGRDDFRATAAMCLAFAPQQMESVPAAQAPSHPLRRGMCFSTNIHASRASCSLILFPGRKNTL